MKISKHVFGLLSKHFAISVAVISVSISSHANENTEAPNYGTSSPFHVPLPAGASTTTPGQYYFTVRIHNARAAFKGKFWDKVSHVMVTTKVVANPLIGDGTMHQVQRLRPISKGQQVQLGLADNLIEPTPAVMNSIKLSVSYLISRSNKIESLQALINDPNGSLTTPMSLVPGAASVSKAITGISTALINIFSDDAGGNVNVMEFDYSLNLPTGDLKDGYYIVFGSRDTKYPLPSGISNASLSVTPTSVSCSAPGVDLSNLSYVVLEVKTFSRRGRQAATGAWARKLNDAMDVIDRNFLFVSAGERLKEYETCVSLLREVQTLMADDHSFLQEEKKEIIREAYAKALVIKPTVVTASSALDQTGRELSGLNTAGDLSLSVAAYRDKVKQSDMIRKNDDVQAKLRRELQSGDLEKYLNQHKNSMGSAVGE